MNHLRIMMKINESCKNHVRMNRLRIMWEKNNHVRINFIIIINYQFNNNLIFIKIINEAGVK